MEEVRLQKRMSELGLCSRREGERLISLGKVKVNGQVVKEMGFKVNEKDIIELEGKESSSSPSKLVTFLFNKPLGVISSSKDDRGRTTVVDFFKDEKIRLYPIGRLDFNTSGALLVSNDGELTNLVTHPSTHLNKTYFVTVDKYVTDEDIAALESGVELEDGLTEPAKIQIKFRSMTKSQLLITIHEGRNRQVRRMFEHFSYHVKSLNRDSVGFLTLGNLKRGEYRLLTDEEVNKLKTLCKANKKNNIIPSYKIANKK
jgi:23S rRNA pseudouridine2605 synthase